MNNIEKIYSESENFKDFTKKYFSYLHQVLTAIDPSTMDQFVNELESARETGQTIFFIGNGGSAATASHFSNDFAVGVSKRSGFKKPIRIMSLTDNNAVLTAIGNDEGYERIFVDQLRVHYRPGDKLVAISASGNSPNILAAVKWVKSQGGKTIALAGFDGGELAKISDLTVLAKTPSGEYGVVEDVHMILDHLISHWFIARDKAQS